MYIHTFFSGNDYTVTTLFKLVHNTIYYMINHSSYYHVYYFVYIYIMMPSLIYVRADLKYKKKYFGGGEVPI